MSSPQEDGSSDDELGRLLEEAFEDEEDAEAIQG